MSAISHRRRGPVRAAGSGTASLDVVPRASKAAARSAGGALAAVACATSVAVLVVMEILAVTNHYAMRVISDTPTFIALIRDLARAPMQPDSVFFRTFDTQSMHASPYLQAVAYLWRAVAPAGHLGDPLALGHFLAVLAIFVGLFTLGMLWLFTRSLAGRTAAFAVVPAVLGSFGPAHVIFSSDLTLGGLLATGYYPTTLAAGLSLGVLMLLRRRSKPASLATVLLLALTLTTDLFSGTVLLIFTIIYSCLAAQRHRAEAGRIPSIVLGAFAVAALWPLFHIFAAFADAGIPAFALIAGAFVAPRVWLMLAPLVERRGARALARARRMRCGPKSELRVAVFGLWSCGMLALWTLYLIGHWPDNPALRSYRLGLYWNDQVYRWPLLLLPGSVGVIGLVRLWRRGAGELAIGAAVLYGIGAIGSVVFLVSGVQLPLYYRFILTCQVPVAVGLATYLGHHRSRRAAIFTWTTLLVALLFKVATLVAVPQSENYFGAPLQSAWTLGRVIGPDTGRIAADPSTSYYLPAATDNGVITLSGHADSGAEPARSDIGYRLMHQVYAGGAYAAGDALLHLWHAGVRWVVAEKSTSLRAADRHLFFFGPYSALIDHSDMALMARYFSRLSQAGTPVYDDAEYTVFRLDGSRLRRAVDAPRSITPADRSAVGATLRTLVGHHGAGAVAAAAELYRRGVRVVTLSLGAFGSQPHIYALGQSLSAPDMVTVAVSARGLGCHAICYSHRGIGWMSRLGQVVHRDSRFMTVVALRAPASAQANPSEPRS